MTNSVWLPADCDIAARSVIDTLAVYGFRVARSFDLRSATAAWPAVSHGACPCPYHGTEQCTCQFLVLLAYGSSGAPVVLTLHSRDGASEAQVVADANAPRNEPAVSQVTAALQKAALVCRPALDPGRGDR